MSQGQFQGVWMKQGIFSDIKPTSETMQKQSKSGGLKNI